MTFARVCQTKISKWNCPQPTPSTVEPFSVNRYSILQLLRPKIPSVSSVSQTPPPILSKCVRLHWLSSISQLTLITVPLPICHLSFPSFFFHSTYYLLHIIFGFNFFISPPLIDYKVCKGKDLCFVHCCLPSGTHTISGEWVLAEGTVKHNPIYTSSPLPRSSLPGLEWVGSLVHFFILPALSPPHPFKLPRGRG